MEQSLRIVIAFGRKTNALLECDTHPTTGDWTSDICLITKVFVDDVVLTTNQHTTGSITSTRNCTRKVNAYTCIIHDLYNCMYAHMRARTHTHTCTYACKHTLHTGACTHMTSAHTHTHTIFHTIFLIYYLVYTLHNKHIPAIKRLA